jgi:hypothetical protein
MQIMGKSKLLLFSLLLLSALTAGATSIIPVDVATMVDRAELIFVGTVIGSESVPTADGSYAFTYVTFDVEQTLKGIARSGKTITLRFAGGQAGTNVFEVAGAPQFKMGGQHLLFVEGNGQSGMPLVGWHQGKLDIVADPVSRQPMLVDHARRAIDGIRDKGWFRGGLALDSNGGIKARRASEAMVVSEEGVQIALDQPQAAERAASVPSVLSQLRTFIAARKASSPSFRDSQFVDSASPSDVPASVRFTAGRAKDTQ